MGRSSSDSGDDRVRRHRDRRSPDRRHKRRAHRSRSDSRTRHRRRRSGSRERRRRRDRRRSRSSSGERDRRRDRRRSRSSSGERRRDRRRSRSSSGERRRRRRRSSSSSSGRSARRSRTASKAASPARPSPAPAPAPAVSLLSDDPAGRAAAIAAVEEDDFVQRSFISGKSRPVAEQGLTTDEQEKLASLAESTDTKTEMKDEDIVHPKLSEGVQRKTDMWVKKICAMRQKLIAAGSTVS
ncbi:probable splicing factor, arginine/serine-rich 7 [Amphibalanus amphitrite]|uniref:probable splicing factor, arginine/serine-rich 7 n=1 Tax=Amphibalanus amphitrite TaxID=1232801 RepID=UPI001C9096B5|nr:probable splicing factor, arginine/serine-rich 7 [Amphibalanus amphitrite]